MKHPALAWLIAVVPALFLWCAGDARGEDAPSVLKDVRYNVQHSTSDLTLTFEGPIRYSSVTRKDRILLTFAHTSVASPPGAARLAFQSGFVRGLTIERLSHDSTRMTVMLREGASYNVVQPNGGRQLRFTVSSGHPLQSASRTAKPPAEARSPLPEKKGERTSSLVDIPGLARSEACEKSPLPATVPPAATADTATVTSLSPLLLVAAMIAFALAGTIVLLVVAGKNQIGLQPAKRATPALPGQPPDPPAEPVEPISDDPSLDDEMEGGEETGEASSEIEGSTEQLAKWFRRGQEELHLVARLHAGGSGPSVFKVSHACSPKATRTQRANAARKLGIGRGEIDLALHLQALADEQLQEEELR